MYKSSNDGKKNNNNNGQNHNKNMTDITPRKTLQLTKQQQTTQHHNPTVTAIAAERLVVSLLSMGIQEGLEGESWHGSRRCTI